MKNKKCDPAIIDRNGIDVTDSRVSNLKTSKGSSDVDFLDWRLRHGGVVEITNIIVGSERGKGIGRTMVEYLVNWITMYYKNYHSIYVFTRKSNEIAHQFYENIEFKVAGVLEGFYSGDNAEERCAIVYVRKIK